MRCDDHQGPIVEQQTDQFLLILQTNIVTPIRLVDLPRSMGHFQHQQKQVFPHPPGKPQPLVGRHRRKGVRKIIVHNVPANVQNVAEKPSQAAGEPLTRLDPHRLHHAD